MSLERKTIGVFGNSRGGTSVVAGIVKILGVHLYSVRLSNDDDQLRKTGDPWSLIAERNAEHDIWGFKNPSLLSSAKTMESMLRNPYYIFVSRDPIASLTQECDLFDTRFLANADERNKKFYTALHEVGVPHIVFSYERLVQDPEKFVHRIADFIGLPFNELAVKFVNQKKGYQKVDDFLKEHGKT